MAYNNKGLFLVYVMIQLWIDCSRLWACPMCFLIQWPRREEKPLRVLCLCSAHRRKARVLKEICDAFERFWVSMRHITSSPISLAEACHTTEPEVSERRHLLFSQEVQQNAWKQARVSDDERWFNLSLSFQCLSIFHNNWFSMCLESIITHSLL